MELAFQCVSYITHELSCNKSDEEVLASYIHVSPEGGDCAEQSTIQPFLYDASIVECAYRSLEGIAYYTFRIYV
jgi:hypothetical protein